MFGHDGWMGFGGSFMWLFWLVLLIAVIVAVIAATRAGKGPGGPPPEDALEILKQRYARGEIDDEEFEHRRRELGR